jgi:hypothetical protein
LFVKDGLIKECEIRGSDKLKPAGERLVGCRHMVNDIKEVFEKENLLKAGFDVYNLF